jgi:inhibitor of cysteine peptidase
MAIPIGGSPGRVRILPRTRNGWLAVGVLAALVAGLGATAWWLAGSHGGPSPATTLGEGDNGRTVTVATGAQIAIQLPGNATTGYTWTATVEDPSVLNEAGPAAFSPSSDALGAGGTYTFRYKAAASGQTDLTLVYQRSWEAGVPPLRTYRITVVVR